MSPNSMLHTPWSDEITLIWCDSSIKCGHAGTAVYDETLWRHLQGITD